MDKQEDERLERKANLKADENSKKFYLDNGIERKSFILHFSQPYYKKNDILYCGEPEYKVKVIKVYKYNWYRKILHFFNIPFKLFDCVKVKEVE